MADADSAGVASLKVWVSVIVVCDKKFSNPAEGLSHCSDFFVCGNIELFVKHFQFKVALGFTVSFVDDEFDEFESFEVADSHGWLLRLIER